LLLGFLIIYIVWGSTYLAIRWGVESIPPFLMGAVRFLLAGGALFAFFRLRGTPAPSRVEWRSASIIGTLLLAVGNGAVSWAEQRVSSGMTSLLIATVPLWIVLAETVQGRRPPLLQWIGVGLGMVGVALLVLPADFTSTIGAPAAPAIEPLGAVVLAGGSLSWTIGSLYSRTAPLPKPAALAISMQMLCGGAVLALMATVTGEWSRLSWSAVTPASLWSLLYLIVFGSLIGFSTYMWLLRVASPAAVGTYAYVNPVVAVLLGVAFAGETVPRQAGLAGLVIIGGVALVTAAGASRRGTKRP
jgi:drug/metabolite transporter (DMT)-like permease